MGANLPPGALRTREDGRIIDSTVQSGEKRLTTTTPSTALLDLFARMALIRAFEARVGALYRTSAIPGFIHTSVGQEAVAVGVCSALRTEDWVSTTHRGHGHCLAKGADVDAAMAELFGKATGLCKGKGGSMHIADAAKGILGANAIVGASVPLAVGAALSAKLLGSEGVAVAFFGEGAVAQGAFHEAVNLAAIWDLPAIFVCENNRYAEFTDSRTMSRRETVAEIGGAYGIEGRQIDGNDVEIVHEAAEEAVDRCRNGAGPALLEAITYRWQGHYEGDPQPYKPTDEADEWLARDPLVIARARLEERGLATAAELDRIVGDADATIDRAEAFARAAEYPAAEEAFRDVYSA
jgi:TPP-dependent pyruvate/acetoin dehydrogenase alpha subunit